MDGSAQDYPYENGSPPCKYDGDKKATTPVGVWMCPMSGCGTEDIMLEKIQKGPMAVALDAGAYSGYRGGVIGCDGGGKSMLDSVLAELVDGDDGECPKMTLKIVGIDRDPQLPEAKQPQGLLHGLGVLLENLQSAINIVLSQFERL